MLHVLFKCKKNKTSVEETKDSYYFSALLPSFGKDGCCNQFLFFSCNNVIFIFLGETNWLIVATGVADCYYNVTDLPTGAAYRFRVACVNKAGQGPYSNLSQKIILDSTGAQFFLPKLVVFNNFTWLAANNLLNKAMLIFAAGVPILNALLVSFTFFMFFEDKWHVTKLQNDSEFNPKY